MGDDLRDVPSRADQAVDRAEHIRMLEDELKIRRLRVEEQRVLIETLEGRIKGLHQANDSFGDLIARAEAAESEVQEWRDTARSEMAGRRAAEAAIASLEDNADVWEQRALKAEAEFVSLLRTYNAAAQAWGRDEAALTAERARLEALLDVSERKLGEWRDRGAELERLRGLLTRAAEVIWQYDHERGDGQVSMLGQEIAAALAPAKPCKRCDGGGLIAAGLPCDGPAPCPECAPEVK